MASALTKWGQIPTQTQGVRLTFLIPALNEERVIGPTIENLRAIVPEAQVVVVDDASQDGTAQIVERLAAGDPLVKLLRRTLPNARQNKGAAMNWTVQELLASEEFQGLDLSREVFVVLDADGRVGSDFAPQVRGAFEDSQVMAAQAWPRQRQLVSNVTGWRSLLSRVLLVQQDLENFMIGYQQRPRQWAGTAALFGNGQCMRASYMAQQLSQGRKPWPDSLLEDFASALEVRLADPAHRIAMLTAQIGQQGLIEPVSLIRQRCRWIQGTMECLPYLPRLWANKTHPYTLIDFSFLILGPWLNTALLLNICSQPFRHALGWQGLPYPTWMGLIFTILPLSYQFNWAMRYTLKQGHPWWYVPYLMFTMPIYGSVVFWSIPMALYRHFTRRKGWYRSVRHNEPVGSSTGIQVEKTGVSGD